MHHTEPTNPKIHQLRRSPTIEWRTLAACRGLDTAMFFPSQGESSLGLHD